MDREAINYDGTNMSVEVLSAVAVCEEKVPRPVIGCALQQISCDKRGNLAEWLADSGDRAAS